MRLESGELSVGDIQRRFDRAAATFDESDYVHRTTCTGLLERLKPTTFDAAVIIDLGSASGKGTMLLSKKYRKARVMSVDVSAEMLRKSSRRKSLFSKVREVQADACRLPFLDHSVDLVFANMLLPWVVTLDQCLNEVTRVLRKDGIFAFATLGPDSMSEFTSFTESRRYPDMHDVGDALVRAGMTDPVLDVDRLQITWKSFDKLLDDFVGCGALGEWPSDMRAEEQSFPDCDTVGRLAIDLELIFGHAWGSGPGRATDEYRIKPGSIGRRGQP